jgi:hypothetical protein
MKTTNFLRTGLLMTAAMVLALTGCKKTDDNKPADDSSPVQQTVMDENRVSDYSDEALTDANIILSGGNLKSTEFLPCNVTVDSANVANDTIVYYVTYDGLNCAETIIRTGKMEIRKRVGTHWYMPGATVSVKYINLHKTRVSNGKSITLNGNLIFENVTGGLLPMLGNGMDAIVHKHWGALVATFDDNTSRTWNIARQQTFTGTMNNLEMAVTGFGTSGEYTSLVTWGINRGGQEFFVSVSEPIVHRQVCTFLPCTGVKVITIPSKNMGATITFGYDENNQPVTNGDCPVKYKLDWYKNGNNGTIYLYL